MRDLKDIIEAALSKGRKTIIETNDDEIDDWDPEDGIFVRLDEAKPVKPLKPLKPGETRKDAEIAADPNHEEGETAEAEAAAEEEADATEIEKNAPADNGAIDRATALMKDKDAKPADKIDAIYAKNAEVAKNQLKR